MFLSHGVPVEWMADVRAATEETLFDVAEHLPHEAAELLLNLGTGARCRRCRWICRHTPTRSSTPTRNAASVSSKIGKSLERALEAPWENRAAQVLRELPPN